MDLLVPKFIKYQLYLLQLENYELGRYWKLLWKKGFWPRKNQPQRKELVWSTKAKALMFMGWALHFLFIILSGLLIIGTHQTDNLVLFLMITALVGVPIYFLWFSLALVLLKPLDVLAKKQLASKARAKIERLSNLDPGSPARMHSPSAGMAGGGLKIIGVAGSYGKTTMKEVLHQVLGARFKVLGTPESVNTPVGIARWVLNKVTDETQIIIVEMGEHYKGDIKEICEIAKPDIAVVTGINESHLERMKNMDTVVATVFEIISNAKPGATVVLNADDNRVMEHYKEFVWPDHRLEFFGKNSNSDKSQVTSHKFNTERLCWDLDIEGVGQVHINLLGEYALGDVDAAIKIGKSLGMSAEELQKGIANIKPVEHRLQPIKSAGNVLVIDDAYNGNPDGVKEAIKVLSRFNNRRKLIITPGLVEMGDSSAEIHRQIGCQLADVADVVILIKNSVSGWIEQGVKDKGLKIKDRGPQIIWFNSAPEAHAGLKNILKPGDVILFQNDWGDQYV